MMEELAKHLLFLKDIYFTILTIAIILLHLQRTDGQKKQTLKCFV